MLSKHNWNMSVSTLGDLPMGSIESTRYARGLTILRRLFAILDSVIDTPSKTLRKTPLTYNIMVDFLKKGMTQTDWETWVINLGMKENEFMSISGKTRGDFDDILEDIADLAPVSGVVTREMIDSKFLDPKYFKQSIIEKAYTAAKVTTKAARAVANKAVEVGNFAVNAKWFLLAGGLGLLVYKLMGQSDKVALAYNTIKGDSKAGLSKLSSKAEEGMKKFREMKMKTKTNPRRRKRNPNQKNTWYVVSTYIEVIGKTIDWSVFAKDEEAAKKKAVKELSEEFNSDVTIQKVTILKD
jgi:hypothetical protein